MSNLSRYAASFAVAGSVLLSACSEEPAITQPTAEQIETTKQVLLRIQKAQEAYGQRALSDIRKASLDGEGRIFPKKDGTVAIYSQPATISTEDRTLYSNDHFAQQYAKYVLNDLKSQPEKSFVFMLERRIVLSEITPEVKYNGTLSVVNFESGRVCTQGIESLSDCFNITDLNNGSNLKKDIEKAAATAKSQPPINPTSAYSYEFSRR